MVNSIKLDLKIFGKDKKKADKIKIIKSCKVDNFNL
tara:strand:+ start:168 stop:275 length:108 start_codon:yes stop_codon:yes gene_type:complete